MKRKIFLPLAFSVLALLIAAGLVNAASPMGSGFTYQGFLKDNGAAANGAYDFEFRLFDAATDGVQIGGIVALEDVPVIDGLFVVRLDFGASAFNGEARWLAIGVRPGDETGAYTALTPRQALTPAPYAVYAGTAYTATTAITATYALSADAANTATTAITATYAISAGDAGTLDGYNATQLPYWGLTGNAGTTAGTNFLGTADNQALEIKVNNTRALRLEPGTSPNLIGGYSGNWVATTTFGAVIAGGGQSGNLNRVVDHMGVVGGGQNNQAGSDDGTVGNNTFATVAGGANNTASGTYSTIGGGAGNTASSAYNSIAGGRNNVTSGNYTFVGGGRDNQAGGPSYGYSAVAGGYQNTALGDISFIGGGSYNQVNGGIYNAIAAGVSNLITTTNWANFIGGGYGNVISGTMGYATIGGGRQNTVGNSYVTIAGGRANSVSGMYATAGGGRDHTVSGDDATIAGGRANVASGSYTTVPGGVYAAATHFGEMAYASGGFAVAGDAQTSVYVLRREYAMAAGAWHDLFLDGNGASQRLTIAAGRAMTFDILIVGSTAAGESAGYRIQGIIKNVGGTTILVGTPTVTVLGEDDAAWNVQVLASDASDALLIQVQGNGETIRWVATVHTAEVAW
ncbi:MAG: hypothetical protein JXM73_10520 [Anaerolineae bacterium]|nr:hypothetical protein [Anaerolineae bacterium]